MFYLRVPLEHLSKDSATFEQNKLSVLKDAAAGNIPAWATKEGPEGIEGVEIVEE